MLVTIVLWVLAVGAFIVTARGPLAWHRTVTAHLRPERAEPTPTGRVLLGWRNVLVAAALLASALAWTFDGARTSQSEWEEVVAEAVAALDADPGAVSSTRVLTEVRDRYGDDVVLLDVTVADGRSGSPITRSAYEVLPGAPVGGDGEVRPGDAVRLDTGTIDLDDESSRAEAAEDFGRGDRPVVCVVVHETEGANAVESRVEAYAGGCDVESTRAEIDQ